MNAVTTEMQEIDPHTARQWLENGEAVLLDIREPDEYAREHIPGARLTPLSTFDAADFSQDRHKRAIFHCASGARTCQAANQLLGTGFGEVYHLDQGLEGWKRAGLDTRINRAAPISIMRQVQLVVGTLILLGMLLGTTVSSGFLLIPAFVGCGLFFAGATGTCAMARMLALLPYNRRA